MLAESPVVHADPSHHTNAHLVCAGADAVEASPENEIPPRQNQDHDGVTAEAEAANDAAAHLRNLQCVPLAAVTNSHAEGFADALFAARSGSSMELPAVAARMTKPISEFCALKELVKLYPWLPTLLAAVLRNQLRRPMSVSSTLAKLSMADAERIGDGLTALLAISPNAEHAVHEWLLQTPAMSEMQLKYRWFTPFMEQIAEQLFTTVGWGVQLRVAVCGLLTYVDVASDIKVTCGYFAKGQVSAAHMSLGFIACNVALQIMYGTHPA